MSHLIEKLANLLQDLSISEWGIADITGLHSLAQKYPRALSIAMAYAPQFEVYDEAQYHHLLEEKRLQLDEVTREVASFFEAHQMKHLTIPQNGQDPETLLAVFPHKLAAVRAGLGWIGKSSLLITNNYGPRVRLATILIDGDMPCGQPVTTSKCGTCKVCVEVCPDNCIKDVEWYPGIAREELLDAHTCSAKREAFVQSIGHKHTCGLCLLACPRGNGRGRLKTPWPMWLSP
jgi:epoxyqueuosine reductase